MAIFLVRCLSLAEKFEKLGSKMPGHSMILLPNYKILDWSKLKAFADDNITVLKMKIFVFDRVESNVGKGENACYPQCFQRAFFPRSMKSGLCGKDFIFSLNLNIIFLLASDPGTNHKKIGLFSIFSIL